MQESDESAQAPEDAVGHNDTIAQRKGICSKKSTVWHFGMYSSIARCNDVTAATGCTW
jgi:hypothetical protein